MKLSYHNTRGQIVTYPIVAEFHNASGQVFYVVGPVPRGTYDTEPPYQIVAKGDGAWRHD
jgi:hypothetical protein